VGDKIMLNTKDLIFKKRPVKKLVEGDFYQCGQVTTANLNENTSGSKY